MGGAIGCMLTSAVGIAISPMPLIAVVLMLATPRGRSNGIAFSAAFAAGVLMVGLLVLVVGAQSGAERPAGGPASWVLWLKLALGVLLMLVGVREWRQRPRGGEQPRTPAWMAAIDTFTPIKAAGLGLLFSAANPKNVVLAIGGALGIAGCMSSTSSKVVALLLFVVAASLCTSVPLAIYLIGGQHATATLNSWKEWMAEHSPAIMMVLFLVLGVNYVGDALRGWSG